MKSKLLLWALCLTMSVQAAVVNYTADDQRIFSNPERGFITMLEGHLKENRPYAVKGQESTLEYHIQRDGISIVLVHYYLDNYRSTATLPEKVLNAFDEDMQVLREKGLKAIIRFSYVNTTYEKGGVESAKDAPLSIAQSHISQYKSHWQANEDVIFCFQAGFVGAWGEWYYTDNYGNQETEMNENRRALVETLLDAVPESRCIQLRTPLFKTSFVGDTEPLNEQTAYMKTPRARLAHHNDAFLERWGDMGTYEDEETQKPYISQETLYVPLGGESCILDADLAEERANYEKTTTEMSYLHWTFIQSGYSTVVTDRWRNDGTFDELNRKMGYRLQLVSAVLPDNAQAGQEAAVELQIRNTGYAPLYNERHAYLVFDNGSQHFDVQLQSDPRRWKPNGEVTTVREQVTLPREMPAGAYELYLYMPDASEKLASDSRYAVRFANENVWDATTGRNRLNATVQVEGKADGLEQVTLDQNAPMFDPMGRPVDASYQGIVIQNGRTYLLVK